MTIVFLNFLEAKNVRADTKYGSNGYYYTNDN